MSIMRRLNAGPRILSTSTPSSPGEPAWNGSRIKFLICVIGENRVDLAVPAGAEIFEQFFGRGAAGTSDREQRVEIVRFVLAESAAASAAMQPLASDVQHFERHITQRTGA